MLPIDAVRCQYPSKRCEHPRSLKISGELHRFCLFHRCRANDAQRRWSQRKLQEANALDANAQRATQQRAPRRAKRKAAAPPHALQLDQPTAPLPAELPCDDLFELIDKSLVDLALPQAMEPLGRAVDPWASFSALLQHQGFIV